MEHILKASDQQYPGPGYEAFSRREGGIRQDESGSYEKIVIMQDAAAGKKTDVDRANRRESEREREGGEMRGIDYSEAVRNVTLNPERVKLPKRGKEGRKSELKI